MTKFGKLMKLMRANIGEGPGRMAEKLELTPDELADIEKGKMPIPDDMFERFKKAYGYRMKESDLERVRTAISGKAPTTSVGGGVTFAGKLFSPNYSLGYRIFKMMPGIIVAIQLLAFFIFGIVASVEEIFEMSGYPFVDFLIWCLKGIAVAPVLYFTILIASSPIVMIADSCIEMRDKK